MSKEDQGEFHLEKGKPKEIESIGCVNIGWLIMNHPKVLIGSVIKVENYGLTAKFIIIPPTIEAQERIINTMRIDRENRNNYLRPGYKGNASSRYSL